MELLTYKDEDTEYSYYLDKNGRKVWHGEYKSCHESGGTWVIYHFYQGSKHGEHKMWNMWGDLTRRLFYINGETYPYVEMNEQEKLLFQIQHPGFRFIED